tara:strand:+ start:89 stop:619 length:531 start_codon:yes stop_codon:yes gene_type:complete
MPHLLITTKRTYNNQTDVNHALVNFDHYINNCSEDIYEEAGSEKVTPDSLCDALASYQSHPNGYVQVEAKVAGQFSVWKHPKTEQTRIYINGQNHIAKVWIEQCEPEPIAKSVGLGQDFKIKTDSRDIHEFETNHSTIGDAKYEVFVESLGLDSMAKASQVLELAPDFDTLLKLAD